MFQELYYAVWANLSGFPLLLRAAIVVFTVLFVIWFFVRPIFFRLLRVLFHMLSLGVKGVCFLGELLLAPLAKCDPRRYTRWYNNLASTADKCNQWLMTKLAKMTKFKLRIGSLVLLYAALMLLIGLPDLLGSVVSKQYLSYFSYVSDIYQQLEMPALEVAAAYQPLIVPHDATEAAEPESKMLEVWLSLSEGGVNGTNVREYPSMDSDVLTIISGDIQILYLGDQTGDWVHIRCLNGVEGWIHRNLLVGVP